MPSRAVRMMTGISIPSLRSACSTESPSRPGSPRSSTIRSNAPDRPADNASLPSLATVAVWPSAVRPLTMNEAMPASSSATRMRLIRSDCSVVDNGIRIVNSAPPALDVATSTCPWCASAIARTMGRPNPKCSPLRDPSCGRAKLWKIASRSASGTPGPESPTQSSTVSPASREPSSIGSPAAVCWTAFWASCIHAWVSR